MYFTDNHFILPNLQEINRSEKINFLIKKRNIMNLYERKHVMKAGSNERIKITACKNMENITMSNFYKKNIFTSLSNTSL